MASRKIGNFYSDEFKVNVLEYYFKHGGDSKFGLKSRTASHFSIDHKTISRMLGNRQLVKNAIRKLSNSKQAQEIGNLDSSQGVPAGFSGGSEQLEDFDSLKILNEDVIEQPIAEVPIIELPEDPDFSILKKSIPSSISEAGDIAKLLVSGTEEVKNIINKECQIIYECKVCRSLFRSLVNLLAHKRIYCQEEYVNIKTLFEKDAGYGITSESPTVVVEPKPPPEGDVVDLDGKGELKIDEIASKLASKRTTSLLSSSTHKGSSSYFSRLNKVNEARRFMNSNCAVLLENIEGNSSAVHQTYIPPQKSKQPGLSIQDSLNKIRSMNEESAELDSDGRIVGEEGNNVNSVEANVEMSQLTSDISERMLPSIYKCNSCSLSFETSELRHSHVEEVHGIERTIFTCPICSVMFLAMWSCVRHLVRVHKKKKHQRDRLKQVIRRRSYAKIIKTSDLSNFSPESLPLPKKSHKLRGGKEPSNHKASKNVSTLNKKASNELSKTKGAKSMGSITPHICYRCGHSFLTGGALGSHALYCKIQPNPSESPKKKIAIQIRKDYKKEEKRLVSAPKGEISSKSSVSPSKLNLTIQARIKEICVVKRLLCIPCNRTYNTVTILKRHAAQHLGWTRFGCSLCSFRSYDKYLSVQHCISEHKCPLKDIDDVVIQDDKLGEFRFYLSTNPSNKNGNCIKSEFEVDTENDHCSGSSDCSASVLSEDSISIKRGVEEDIGSTNGMGDLKVDGGKSLDANENVNGGIGEKDPERPQRTRKLIEEKDFVYEPLKLVIPRCDDLKSDDENTTSRNRVSTYERSSSKRRASSPISQPKKPRHHKSNDNHTSKSPLANEINSRNVKINTIQVVSCDKDNMLKLKIQNKTLTSTLSSASNSPFKMKSESKSFSKTGKSSEIKLSKDTTSNKAVDQGEINCLENDSNYLSGKVAAKNINSSDNNRRSSQANNIENEVCNKLKRTSDVKQKEKSKLTEPTSSPNKFSNDDLTNL